MKITDHLCAGVIEAGGDHPHADFSPAPIGKEGIVAGRFTFDRESIRIGNGHDITPSLVPNTTTGAGPGARHQGGEREC